MGDELLCDAMFVCAHPDDGELLAGGLMASLVRRGRRVLMVDATRGEMGTRGSAEQRAAEAAEAARILGVERHNLGLPDGRVASDLDGAERAVVRAIRHHRPRLVFTHTPGDHHPDHNAVHEAVRRAFFRANVGGYDTDQPRHAPRRLMYFVSSRTDLPARVDFIADISDVWQIRTEAVRAFRSQVQGGASGGPATYLTSDLFWHRLEARYAHFGSLINVRYGEPYVVEGVLRLDDPTDLPDVNC